MIWKDDVTNLPEYALSILAKENAETPRCCKSANIHVYAHKYDESDASVWVWCSSCGSWAHLDRVKSLSQEWENCPDVTYEKLTAVPKYLNSISNVVDAHLKKFLQGDK